MIKQALAMARRTVRCGILGFGLLVVAGCSGDSDTTLPSPSPDQRWHSQAQSDQGKAIYQRYCQDCHNARARGVRQWKKRDAQGHFPPPPLDGTGHAWHHSLPTLMQTIREGGQPNGGQMPPFKDKLNTQQMLAVMAYFQSYWPDRIYRRWAQKH
ncbi:cytochrome c [Marinobacteraceae bacterium S3BR75-40.1]